MKSPIYTATRSSVAGSAAPVVLLAANNSRRGATIYNDSGADLYLGFGSTAPTSTNFTVKLGPQDYYELPGDGGHVFCGEIQGVWTSATGAARITEIV